MAQKGNFSADDLGLDTELTPQEEVAFQAWKTKYAPKDSGEDYDLRGAFKEGLTPDPETGHWPDTYKKPNHPTFSNESKYYDRAPEKAGSWTGDKHDEFVPPSKGKGAYSLADGDVVDDKGNIVVDVTETMPTSYWRNGKQVQYSPATRALLAHQAEKYTTAKNPGAWVDQPQYIPGTNMPFTGLSHYIAPPLIAAAKHPLDTLQRFGAGIYGGTAGLVRHPWDAVAGTPQQVQANKVSMGEALSNGRAGEYATRLLAATVPFGVPLAEMGEQEGKAYIEDPGGFVADAGAAAALPEVWSKGLSAVGKGVYRAGQAAGVVPPEPPVITPARPPRATVDYDALTTAVDPQLRGVYKRAVYNVIDKVLEKSGKAPTSVDEFHEQLGDYLSELPKDDPNYGDARHAYQQTQRAANKVKAVKDQPFFTPQSMLRTGLGLATGMATEGPIGAVAGAGVELGGEAVARWMQRRKAEQAMNWRKAFKDVQTPKPIDVEFVNPADNAPGTGVGPAGPSAAPTQPAGELPPAGPTITPAPAERPALPGTKIGRDPKTGRFFRQDVGMASMDDEGGNVTPFGTKLHRTVDKWYEQSKSELADMDHEDLQNFFADYRHPSEGTPLNFDALKEDDLRRAASDLLDNEHKWYKSGNSMAEREFTENYGTQEMKLRQQPPDPLEKWAAEFLGDRIPPKYDPVKYKGPLPTPKEGQLVELEGPEGKYYGVRSGPDGKINGYFKDKYSALKDIANYNNAREVQAARKAAKPPEPPAPEGGPGKVLPGRWDSEKGAVKVEWGDDEYSKIVPEIHKQGSGKYFLTDDGKWVDIGNDDHSLALANKHPEYFNQIDEMLREGGESTGEDQFYMAQKFLPKYMKEQKLARVHKWGIGKIDIQLEHSVSDAAYAKLTEAAKGNRVNWEFGDRTYGEGSADDFALALDKFSRKGEKGAVRFKGENDAVKRMLESDYAYPMERKDITTEDGGYLTDKGNWVHATDHADVMAEADEAFADDPKAKLNDYMAKHKLVRWRVTPDDEVVINAAHKPSRAASREILEFSKEHGDKPFFWDLNDKYAEGTAQDFRVAYAKEYGEKGAVRVGKDSSDIVDALTKVQGVKIAKDPKFGPFFLTDDGKWVAVDGWDGHPAAMYEADPEMKADVDKEVDKAKKEQWDDLEQMTTAHGGNGASGLAQAMLTKYMEKHNLTRIGLSKDGGAFVDMAHEPSADTINELEAKLLKDGKDPNKVRMNWDLGPRKEGVAKISGSGTFNDFMDALYKAFPDQDKK